MLNSKFCNFTKLEQNPKIRHLKPATTLTQIVGAGSTTLIDTLLVNGYSNLIVNDISSYALNNIKKRLGESQKNVTFIVDDLINPATLKSLPKIDVWNDRAVLHFFTKKRSKHVL